MTYTELEAVPTDMRSGNEDYLTAAAYPDATLVLMQKDAAKKVLLLDLQAALSIAPGDETTIEQVLVDHTIRIQLALAYKQLELIYAGRDEGEESKAHARMKYYRGLYSHAQGNFAQLKRPAVSKVQFVPVKRG